MVDSDYEEGRSPKAAPRKFARQSIHEGSSSRRPYSEDEVRLRRNLRCCLKGKRLLHVTRITMHVAYPSSRFLDHQDPQPCHQNMVLELVKDNTASCAGDALVQIESLLQLATNTS